MRRTFGSRHGLCSIPNTAATDRSQGKNNEHSRDGSFNRYSRRRRGGAGCAMMPVDAAPAVPGGLEPPALRCTVRLPMEPKGWNTVLARCDGRPIAIGAPGGTPIAPGASASQYAKDMQVITAALSRPPPGFPLWLSVLSALLGAGALYALIKNGARRLPRLYSTVFHPR
jgi:hypothetical protein